MFYVYVLHPLRDSGLYIGYSTDLRRRLGEHKQGASQAVSYRGPWNLIYYEAHIQEADAVGRERYLKSGGGRKSLRSQLHNYFAKHPVEPREAKPRLCGEAFYARFNASTLKRVNVLAAASLLLTSCANQHFRVPAEGPPSDAPRYVELLSETQVATLHFPPGPYSFYAVDDLGYYYRAPRKILEHTGGGSVPCNGGIFLSKRDPRKLRGYVYLAGALTHVGDLSRTRHDFHD